MIEVVGVLGIFAGVLGTDGVNESIDGGESEICTLPNFLKIIC
jgi:hypothetical protein